LVTGLRAQTMAASGLFEKLFEFLETTVPIFAEKQSVKKQFLNFLIIESFNIFDL
jgi:hypothetical protein